MRTARFQRTLGIVQGRRLLPREASVGLAMGRPEVEALMNRCIDGGGYRFRRVSRIS